MLRMLAAGIWGGLVALGASFGAGAWLDRQANPSQAAGLAVKGELKRTPPINVPVVRDGALQGYLVLRVGYFVDAEALKAQPQLPEALIMDETLRVAYSDDKIDFRKLEKYHIDAIMQRVLSRVRSRMKNEVLRDVLIQEFNFVPISAFVPISTLRQ
jgi:hypothetical protein